MTQCNHMVPAAVEHVLRLVNRGNPRAIATSSRGKATLVPPTAALPPPSADARRCGGQGLPVLRSPTTEELSEIRFGGSSTLQIPRGFRRPRTRATSISDSS
jgi:hypothetical protein